MTASEFYELTDENPEDFFGPDWENALEYWAQEQEALAILSWESQEDR